MNGANKGSLINYITGKMLDRLYGDSGIDISVNIAKYRQRKGYLSS